MGPETPHAPKEEKLRVDSRGLRPPVGVRDLLRPSGPPTLQGVRSRHVARRHGLEREPSAGRPARPLHLMQWDKACSADAARETVFVRPHCAPRITKVHSSAACTAPAQSPSAALNGYDGTALFHHAAYAASYTAHLSNVAGGATSCIWHRPDKTALGHGG